MCAKSYHPLHPKNRKFFTDLQKCFLQLLAPLPGTLTIPGLSSLKDGDFDSPLLCTPVTGQLRTQGWLSKNDTKPVANREGSAQLLASQCLTHGAGSRARTDDLLITNQLLYQLSYAGLSSVRSPE
jgi:hypothetical protein